MTSPDHWSALYQEVRNHIPQRDACDPAMLIMTRDANLVLAVTGGPLTPGALSDRLRL
jgi:hypothetical protein